MEEKDKIIVITGATGALGRKTAHEFAECGYSLAKRNWMRWLES